MNPIVIIGNGISSVSAVEAFRKHDKDTPIVIFGDEPYYAYYRMRLSGLIGETFNLEKLYIRKPEWYRDLNIEVNLGQKVISIDTEKKLITLKNGDTICFSKLMIASGSSAFVPPIPGKELPGVFSIRSLDDVKNFNDFISDKAQGAVIGGGPLGLEIAWSLAKNGKKIHVLEGSPYILYKLLDETAARLLTDLGQQANITFIVQEKLSEITGKGQLTDIQLGNGKTLPVEFVVFATGVRSNTDIVKNTVIQVARGIIVDEYMQTSVKDIYAAGDVAEYKGQVHGIWPVAQEQGKTAGLNMAGKKISYSEVVPSNYLKVFDVEIYSIGDLCKDGKPHDTIKNYGNNIYRVVFFKDNIPVGAILFGDVKPAIKISKAIKARTRISDKIIKSQDFEGFLKECDGN